VGDQVENSAGDDWPAAAGSVNVPEDGPSPTAPDSEAPSDATPEVVPEVVSEVSPAIEAVPEASADGDELLTVAEAARRAGIHANTVRKYLRASEIPFFLRDMTSGDVVSGDLPEAQWPGRYQYLVPARAVHFLASQSGDAVSTGPASSPGSAPATGAEADDREAATLRASLEAATRQLTASEERLAELRGERDWLRVHLRDITAFLPAAREETETARTDLQLAREDAERERERAEEARLRADEIAREKDIEIRARDAAIIRYQSLSWWSRRGVNLEQLIREEVDRLRSADE